MSLRRWVATGIMLGASALLGVACSNGSTGTNFNTPDASGGDGAAQCTGGSALCGSSCTSLASDNENCGACGKACTGGTVCSKGACAATCGGGTTLCGSTCNDTQVDPKNCGACGTACKTGEVCSAGKCASTCGPNQQTCGSSCVSTDTDNANCGACGTICGAGSSCVAGKCTVSCQAPQTLCNPPSLDAGVSDASSDGGSGSYCANFATDNANCGSCGNVCGPTKVCSNGTCATSCTQGQTQCQGQNGPFCANTATDNANCGGCGNACASGLSCVNGTCTLGCGSLTKCINLCVDTQNNPQNCGGCGNVCPNNQVCVAGQCAVSCGSLTKCTNVCVDTQNNPQNCGGCGNLCTSGQLCSAGKCVPNGGTGTVRDVNGNIGSVTYVKCGNGSNTNCTQAVAESSCTALGMKLVSHASDGTAGVVSLGATNSCQWSISYFTNNDPAVAGQCLIGMSNASWSSCCTLGQWHGNIVTVPATLGTQFGYVNSANTGYNSNLTNVSGTTWGCVTSSTTPPARSGCTTYYVACK